MKRYLVGLLTIFCFVLLVACHSESSTSYGLTIQKAVLAKMTAEGLVPVTDSTYKLGDKVYYVLLNVGKFAKGADGMNSFDMDVQVQDPDGKTILSQNKLLGKNGHIALANDIAPSPHGIFTTSANLQPGKYKIKITIYDLISKGSASASTTFMLTK